jgi:hypothetical protein
MDKNAGRVETRHLKNTSQRLPLRLPQSETPALLAEIAAILPLTREKSWIPAFFRRDDEFDGRAGLSSIRNLSFVVEINHDI